MPDDIVERLERAIVGAGGAWSLLLAEAADEIERLRSLIRESYDAEHQPWHELRFSADGEWKDACDRLSAARQAVEAEARRG